MTRVDPDDIEGLLLDVVTDLAGRAGSWDPSWGAALTEADPRFAPLADLPLLHRAV